MKNLKTLLLAAALAVGCATPAAAHIIFTPGNNPGVLEENILFGQHYDDVTNLVGTSNQTGVDLTFFTLTQGQLIGTQGIGQSDIICTQGCNPYAVGGANGAQLTSLGINVQSGWGAKDFIGNLDFGQGTASIRVTDELGAVFDFILGNGQNFFTLDAINNQVITQILITGAIPGENFGWNDFKQPRISGLCRIGSLGCGSGPGDDDPGDDDPPTEVPEPSSLAVFGFGLIAAGWYAARRRKTA